jgi:hypothetical protein
MILLFRIKMTNFAIDLRNVLGTYQHFQILCTRYYDLEEKFLHRTLKASFRNSALVQKKIIEFILEFDSIIVATHVFIKE